MPGRRNHERRMKTRRTLLNSHPALTCPNLTADVALLYAGLAFGEAHILS